MSTRVSVPIVLAAAILASAFLDGADLSGRKVDPTFLHGYIPDIQAQASDLTTSTCAYKPLFGKATRPAVSCAESSASGKSQFPLTAHAKT